MAASALALIPTERCPVCGGRDRRAADGMSTGGTVYLRHAAEPLGLSVQQLIDRIGVFQCDSCGSYFCDPWLSPELASRLFCAGAPDHIAGWAAFEQWLRTVRDRDSVLARNQRLLGAIARRIGPVASYAEFGCPFQGLLLQFRGDETSPAERVASFSRALRRASDPRWTRLARIHHAAQRLSSAAVITALRISAAVDAVAAGRAAVGQTVRERSAAAPARRYLLTEDTSKGWGSNCSRYGATCQYFAHTVLDAHVLPLDEVQRSRGRFDLVAIFNSLDHSTFPIEVLRKALAISDHVLVVTHDARHAGRQHLYALTDRFSGWLAAALDGASVEDLRDDVDSDGAGDYNYLLVTSAARRPATIAS